MKRLEKGCIACTFAASWHRLTNRARQFIYARRRRQAAGRGRCIYRRRRIASLAQSPPSPAAARLHRGARAGCHASQRRHLERRTSCGMTVPCWWCHSSPLRLRAALLSSNASPHRPGLHGRPCGLSEGYQRKSPTPQALLEIFLERVARVDRGLNAVVVRAFARARARAAAADEALRRGELWGPLHGLPVTVAAEMAVAGLQGPTSCLAVARLEAAGAVVFGKTNCGGAGEKEGRL